MELFLIILLIVAIIGVGLFIKFRKKKSKGVLDAGVDQRIKTTVKTKVGDIYFGLENGVTTPTNEIVGAIVEGLETTINKGIARGYQSYTHKPLYEIVILKADSVRYGVPVLKLSNEGYEGTNFDQGGYMYVAGLAKASNAQIIIPEPTIDNLENLKLIVSYEAEHIILYFNDKDEYERTAVHKPETPHPLM